MEGDLFPLSGIRHFEQTSVIVCVADIRGFTQFVKEHDGEWRNAVPELLLLFYEGLNEAFGDALKNIQQDNEFAKRLLKHAYPVLKKTMGDGVILVWEPPSGSDKAYEIGFNLFVLDFIQICQANFYKKKRRFLNLFPNRKNLILPLEIGFGFTGGSAYKLDGLIEGQIDYAGTPLNLATRLQKEAKPRGIVATLDLMVNLFLERISMMNEGEIDYIIPSGIGKGVPVWKSIEPEISKRRSRDISTFQTAMATMIKNGNNFDKTVCPITVDDTQDIFYVREHFETQFVEDLIDRLRKDPISQAPLLKSLDPSLREEFHEGIAKLSTSNTSEAVERCNFVKWAYLMTREVHSYAIADETSKVRVKHEEIYNEIVHLNTKDAIEGMERHLNESCAEGKTELLKIAEQQSLALLDAITRATKRKKK